MPRLSEPARGRAGDRPAAPEHDHKRSQQQSQRHQPAPALAPKRTILAELEFKVVLLQHDDPQFEVCADEKGEVLALIFVGFL